MKGIMIMVKKDLIKAVANKTAHTQSEATKMVDGVIGAMFDILSSGEKIQLVGFGTFDVSERSSYTGRNPSTGETMEFPASKTIRFRPGQPLKDELNK